MRIRGADDLTPAELAAELEAGGRFVYFEYCISVVFLTLRCPTDIYFLPAGESGRWRGLPYTVLSLLFGWWGVPMGVLYTPLALFTNLAGGCDVTEEVRALLAQQGLAGEPARPGGATE